MGITPMEAIRQLRGLQLGFAVTHTFFSACQLGLFDLLEGEPRDSVEIGKCLGIDAEICRRMLVVLDRLELVDRVGDQFSNSELGAFLTSESRYPMKGLVGIENLIPMWKFLPEAMKTKGPVWEQTFGASSQEIFTELYQDPVELRKFCEYLDAYSLVIGEDIAECYDFSQHRCVMDVAGGTGQLAMQIALKYPNLHGIVMDLPPVLKIADEKIIENRLADRFKTETADLFEGPYPSGADVITLSWILHDWSEEGCRKILRHCFEALPKDGVLIVSESVMNEDQSGSDLWSEIYSLFMLVVCESGSKERMESEHRRLLGESGFESIEIIRREGPKDVIIASKP